jgi:hypothetical protein
MALKHAEHKIETIANDLARAEQIPASERTDERVDESHETDDQLAEAEAFWPRQKPEAMCALPKHLTTGSSNEAQYCQELDPSRI